MIDPASFDSVRLGAPATDDLDDSLLSRYDPGPRSLFMLGGGCAEYKPDTGR